MSQENNTGLKTPKPLAEPCRHLENENIPQDRLEARLKGTESNWAAAQGRGTPETDRSAQISSKTKTSEPEAEQETPPADAKAEKEVSSETRREETNPQEKTKDAAESPSAETTEKGKTSMPENLEKDPTEPRKGTDTKAETTDTITGGTETKIMKTTNSETSTTPETGTTPQGQERRPSQPSEDSESSPKTSESKEPDTSSRTNTSTENAHRTASELHRWAKERELESENSLLKDSIASLKKECNDLVMAQTEKVEALRGEISETTAKLEGEMKELRQGLVKTMRAYSECLSMKTNAIYTRMEESLDKLEMNSKWIREGTGQLIEEDRAMLLEIPSTVEKELTRAANETSEYVDKSLEETVKKYTDEIDVSTKFLKKQVEERKKASRFEKVTDVLMRVCCPILAAGTFVLACVVTCLL